MPRLSRRRPSPSMIVACLALVFSVTGTGIAAVAVALPRNSVGTPQLQDNSVTARKLAGGAVRSLQVLDGSLRSIDFAPSQVPRGKPGPQGPAGPAGQAGPAGPKGDPGTGGIPAITDRTASIVIDDTSPTNGQYVTRDVSKTCNTGEKAISGGTSWGDDKNDLELTTVWIKPLLNTSNQVVGFSAKGGNDSGQPSTLTVHVLCYTG